MPFSFEALRTFAAVVETGGVSPAARRLGVAKSVISKRLADLEAVAGAELVRRGARAARATDAGQVFYVRAKRILAELDAALEESRGDRGELRGSLRVAAPLSFSRMFLSEVFVDFASAHPGVALTVDCDDRLIDIRAGGYDMAVRIGRLQDSALIARRLAPARLALVASPAYLSRAGIPASPAALSQHSVIAYGNAAMPHQWRFEGRHGEESVIVTVQPRLTVNAGEIMRDAVRAGLGLAILPLFMAADAIERRELVAVLPGWSLEEGAISAVWLPDLSPSRRLRALIALLAAEVPARLAAAGAL